MVCAQIKLNNAMGGIGYYKTFKGFARFARENSIMRRFLANLLDGNTFYNIKNPKDMYRHYILDKRRSGFTDYALRWDRTYEGEVFWNRVNTKLSLMENGRLE